MWRHVTTWLSVLCSCSLTLCVYTVLFFFFLSVLYSQFHINYKNRVSAEKILSLKILGKLYQTEGP